MNQNVMIITLLLISFIISGCVSIPKDLKAVDDFQVDRYLGRWYEIARLDHSFERGLNNVSAEYSLRDDGGIKVVNRGFNPESGEWKTAEGKAYFVSGQNTGRLKVSFWGPFYGGYNIIGLDRENYSYALVCGSDKSYLWILARTGELEEEIKNQLVEKAKVSGFETEKLIWVEQGK